MPLQIRRATAAEWSAKNRILAEGEPAYERDTGRQKIGDGITPWTSLPYQPGADLFAADGKVDGTLIRGAMGAFDPRKPARGPVASTDLYAGHLAPSDGGQISSVTGASTGSDADGAYWQLADAQGTTQVITGVSEGASYTFVLRCKGTIPNAVTVNFFNTGFVGPSSVRYVVGSTFGNGKIATTKPVLIPISFTVPIGATPERTKFNLQFDPYPGQDLKIYGGNWAADATLPPRMVTAPHGLPFKGVSIQKFRNRLTWLGAPGIAPTTRAQIASELDFLIANFDPGGIRLWLGLDSGLTYNAGVPSGFTSQALATARDLFELCDERRLRVVPVLYTPLRGGSGDDAADMSRAAMTNSAVRDGYAAVTAAFVDEFDGHPCIAAWDLVNEAPYMLAANRAGSTTYSYGQSAALFEALSAAVRAHSSKPIHLSLPDGGDGCGGLYTIDQDSYDVVDWHCYGAVLRYYQRTLSKPIVSLEVGPDPADSTDAAKAYRIGLMLRQLGQRAGAAYPWTEGNFRSGPTTLTGNALSIEQAKRYA